MAVHPPGNPNTRGSVRRWVGEQDLQLAEHHIPVLAPGVPVLYNPLSRQIQHPAQRIVIGEAGLVLGNLPELPVQALNDIGRVYDFPNLRRVFKKGAQNIPIFLPALNTGGILLAPGLRKLPQIFLRFVQTFFRSATTFLISL